MPEVSRRGFVTMVGGGVAVSAAAAAVAVTGASTDSQVISRGRGRWTRFGTVAVLGAGRHPLGSGDGHHLHSVGHSPSPHATWSETIRIEVEVHNGTAQPITVSPGQFRLRLEEGGPSVTHHDAGWPVGPLGASETVTSWVSFLVPPAAAPWVEYAEPEASYPQAFALGLES